MNVARFNWIVTFALVTKQLGVAIRRSTRGDSRYCIYMFLVLRVPNTKYEWYSTYSLPYILRSLVAFLQHCYSFVTSHSNALQELVNQKVFGLISRDV